MEGELVGLGDERELKSPYTSVSLLTHNSDPHHLNHWRRSKEEKEAGRLLKRG